MNIPLDATHYCELKNLYYKQVKDKHTIKVYVWSNLGHWVSSIGGSIDNHEFIRPIKKDVL